MANSGNYPEYSIDFLRTVDRGRFVSSFHDHLESIKEQQALAEDCNERYSQVFWYMTNTYSDRCARKPSPHSAAFALWSKENADLQNSLEQEQKIFDLVRNWKNYLDDWVKALELLGDLWELVFEAVDANEEDEVREIQEYIKVEEEKVTRASAGTMRYGRLVLVHGEI